VNTKRGPLIAAALLVVAVVLFVALHRSSDSSNAFQLHIHGYEIEKAGKPGQTVNVSFPATIDGEFEIEVHHLVNGEEAGAVEVGNLTVNP
jgi:hypothetical protein